MNISTDNINPVSHVKPSIAPAKNTPHKIPDDYRLELKKDIYLPMRVPSKYSTFLIQKYIHDKHVSSDNDDVDLCDDETVVA